MKLKSYLFCACLMYAVFRLLIVFFSRMTPVASKKILWVDHTVTVLWLHLLRHISQTFSPLHLALYLLLSQKNSIILLVWVFKILLIQRMWYVAKVLLQVKKCVLKYGNLIFSCKVKVCKRFWNSVEKINRLEWCEILPVLSFLVSMALEIYSFQMCIMYQEVWVSNNIFLSVWKYEFYRHFIPRLGKIEHETILWPNGFILKSRKLIDLTSN